ncbi:MAG: FAD/NAD(P)-binding protein, partial [Lapillicoccus sp.]
MGDQGDRGDASADVGGVPPHGRRVVVLGAGAAGTLSTIALVRQLESLGTAVEVVVVDPGEPAGGGVAFSTTDPAHLLNVRTRDLSAHLDDVGHFTAWVGLQDAAADPHPADPHPADPDGFLPRGRWGDYLRAVLQETTAAARWVTVHSVRAMAVAMHPTMHPTMQAPGHDHALTDRVTVVLDTGVRVVADAVVLALG